jgi:hypothetical protein
METRERRALRALVDYIEYKMDDGERPCPLCGHHYQHTHAGNIHWADRVLEPAVCPYVLAKSALMALDTAPEKSYNERDAENVE